MPSLRLCGLLLPLAVAVAVVAVLAVVAALLPFALCPLPFARRNHFTNLYVGREGTLMSMYSGCSPLACMTFLNLPKRIIFSSR